MAKNRKPKKPPMSRKSILKKMKLMKSNMEVIKKLQNQNN